MLRLATAESRSSEARAREIEEAGCIRCDGLGSLILLFYRLFSIECFEKKNFVRLVLALVPHIIPDGFDLRKNSRFVPC